MDIIYIVVVCFVVLSLFIFCFYSRGDSVQTIKNCRIRGVVSMNNSVTFDASDDFVGNICATDGTVICTTLRINGITYFCGDKIEASVFETCRDKLKGTELGTNATIIFSGNDLYIVARNTARDKRRLDSI